MTQATGARIQLEDLVARGLDWAVDPSRMLAEHASPRRAAVLVLFGVLDGVPARSHGPVAYDLDVLLQRRASTMGHHPGQIAFPGGGVDAADASPAAAALREAVEETGLDPDGVEILGTLPELPLPVSNNLVTPVPAWWTRISEVAAVDALEAVEVFRVPVADLIDPANRASVSFPFGGRTVRTPAFVLGGATVWGFTAIVLSRMFEELDWAVPWDRQRIIEV